MISSNFFDILSYKFDIDKLRDEVKDIVKTYGYKGQQISLVYREGYKDNCWFDGVGTSFQFDENRNPKTDSQGNILRRFTEDEFKNINPGLENTELEKVYETCKKDHNISRFRIAKLDPRRTYGWHKDEEIRIHVPVITAPGCFLITEDGVASHLPADGSVYMFYARNGYHTAVNSDYKIERIHLLLNIC